ncbi:hypothetical protein PAHAL_7G015000 [Panicum hallii]|uniref:FCP1 homology domain-containing protein n=1 Tax=Panicum hallii TaxID=206008 RepID=A0A2T8IAQ3_9POAL|nr:hypothetical protein PAHAL_7G015000 [Panicum hallii]PVH34718.1 hypothetical protein PAHAL_7G015000 [Panicum hallii]
MHTRKKGAARSAAGDHVNPKTSRPSRRSTQPPVAEKKVTDLITSSSKKQKPVGVTSKKHSKGGRKLLAACDTADTENEAPQVAPSIPHDLQHSDDGADDRPSNSIYSPTYHHHKDGGLNNLSKAGSLEEQTAPVHGSKESSLKSGPNLACNTCDGSQDSTSTEGYGDAEETEEYDEFDPYSFIKDLPDLSTVVPKFRPVLLPKQTRSCPTTTLVLDLDETLVHSTLEHCEDADFTFPVHFNFREHTIYVRCRPYLKEFMERVASMFETIIFTASQSIYAEQLLNVLDPKRKLFRHRVYRESCVYVEGNYLKDLTVLGRDLTRVMIVDNSPQAFGFQLDNGIPIESWFDDPNDTELLKLLPFLESLVGVEDVRPYIARKFNLREKVATAASLTMDMQM